MAISRWERGEHDCGSKELVSQPHHDQLFASWQLDGPHHPGWLRRHHNYSQNDHTLLNGKIVVAWHREKGSTVSRFKRYDHTEVLEPENRGYESITLSTKNNWKVIAKVLWWIGKAA